MRDRVRQPYDILNGPLVSAAWGAVLAIGFLLSPATAACSTVQSHAANADKIQELCRTDNFATPQIHIFYNGKSASPIASSLQELTSAVTVFHNVGVSGIAIRLFFDGVHASIISLRRIEVLYSFFETNGFPRSTVYLQPMAQVSLLFANSATEAASQADRISIVPIGLGVLQEKDHYFKCATEFLARCLSEGHSLDSVCRTAADRLTGHQPTNAVP